MNKTVNINLAGIFFHIDENAYIKLQRYLEAIKRSFTDSQGRSEIISDIEARIAELFTERVKHDKQVIGLKEVDEVVTIMGQPEDYLVDDEIFEDEPVYKKKTGSRSKKLFRDTDNSYVGGVSSGLAHYFGINVIWVRLLWFLLIFGAGTGIFLYILLWILVPEALTTSDKLMMSGEKVTISNIEKKIRDGFESVSDTVKNVDFQKHGNQLKTSLEQATDSISESVKRINLDNQGNRIKSSSKSFFDTIGDIAMFFLKVFAKFIGVILILTGAAALIAMFVALLSASILDSVHFPGIDFADIANTTGAPFWLFSMLIFFAFAVPFFMLLYLGLKILITNLKSIGNATKYSLLGVWILSIIGLAVYGAKQGLSYKEKGAVIKTERFENITVNDTLKLSMSGNDYFAERFDRDYGFDTDYNENGDLITFSQGVRLIVKSTKDSIAKIKINKKARGSTYEKAKKRANAINYSYALINNELLLDNYLTIPNDTKIKDQRVEITLYIPIGSVLYADSNTYDYHSNNSNYYNDILDHGQEEKYLKVLKNKLKCIDCLNKKEDKAKVNVDSDNARLKIDDEGLEATSSTVKLKVDNKGVKANNSSVEVEINEDGININAPKKEN